MRSLLRCVVETVARCVARVTCLERMWVTAARPIRHIPVIRGFWWRIRGGAAQRKGGTAAGLRWVRLPSGGGMYVDLADMLGCLYWERRLYEPVTTAFVLQRLHEGCVFADIGANHGYFSLVAAGTVGPSGSVVSFEANPCLRQILRSSVERNRWVSRVTVADCALADDERDITLYLSTTPSLSGISSMFPWEEHLKAGNLDKAQSVTVRARKFDNWAAQVGIQRLDMVKIDVEGAELLVLKGMRESIARLRPMHIICETGLEGPVTQFLTAMGYSASPLELHAPDGGWGNILYTYGGRTHG